MFKRLCVQFISVFAILSLCVASVAACACSHHETPSEAETLSCHSRSHDDPKPEIVSQVPSGVSVDPSCECFIRTIAPAITAKNESKRFKTSGADQIDDTAIAWFENRSVTIAEAISVHFEPPIFYALNHSRSGPSRAPPRL